MFVTYILLQKKLLETSTDQSHRYEKNFWLSLVAIINLVTALVQPKLENFFTEQIS